MSTALKRLLKYVSYDTQSQDGVNRIPSTEKQFALADQLAEELETIGAANVWRDENCYVYGILPSNLDHPAPSIGLIAHMDTSPDMSGADIHPQIVENYDGGDICLNEEKDIWMRIQDFPELAACKGKTMITTDGTTLLGADDKAGIAEIMTMVEYLVCHPEIRHGRICIAFTPDEEVGHGADLFDVDGFGADLAYTVDGGPIGEIKYENFNAASGKVVVHGKNVHPGTAKNKMVHASLIAMEFQNMLPEQETPMHTEGYEGFYHMTKMTGSVENAELRYIIRDHDREKFEQKKAFFLACAERLNEKYDAGTVEAAVEDSYYNMKEKILPHMELIEYAKASMEELGVVPNILPIRGGTDGARLSFMGLPCPNLCTGGYNFHGKYECIPAEDMEKIVEILIGIVTRFGQQES